MTRPCWTVVGLALSSCALAGQSRATVALYPGVAAPPLKILRWIKGGQILGLPATGVQVVEFWATWCEPCITAMPALTALAHKYKDVTFIGASVDNRDSIALDNFVAGQGDKMDYHVGYAGVEGMASSYLDAARQPGIPVAFVIKNRVMQWIGDPDFLDDKVSQVLAGSNDLKADRLAFLAEVHAEPASEVDTGKLADADQLFMAGGHAEAHKAIDALPDSPEKQHVILKWKSVEDPQGFLAGANALIPNDPDDVGRLAIEVLDYPGTSKVALKAVEDALKATKRQSDYLFYCAVSICDASGEKKTARAYAREALKLLQKHKTAPSDPTSLYYKHVLG